MCAYVCVRAFQLYCVSLGSPPRIAVLTASYNGLSKVVKIKSMLLQCCSHCCCRVSCSHTRPKEFENEGFTKKTHQVFSVHTTPEEFKNATIIRHFGFVFEKNSIREIT